MSGFLERAKRIYHKGDVVSSAFVLAEGLKREPSNAEALEWLMHLYVREMPRPGIERDLLKILHQQPNGGLLLSKIRARLHDATASAKLDALARVVATDGEPVDSAVGPAPPAELDAAPPGLPDDRPLLRTPVPGPILPPPAEDWSAFANPLDGGSSPRVTGTARSVDAPGPRVDPGALPTVRLDLAADDTFEVEASASTAGQGRGRTVWVVVVLVVLVVGVLALLFVMPRADEAAVSGAFVPVESPDGSGAP